MHNEQGQSGISAPQGKCKATVFILITLLSGVIIGSGLTMIVIGQHPKPVERGPEFISAKMLRRMERELALRPEQKEQLDPILQRHMKIMDDLRQEARPKIEQAMKAMNESILSILDDNQRLTWQDQIKKMQDRFARDRHDRNRRGDRSKIRDQDESRQGDKIAPKDRMRRQRQRKQEGFPPPSAPNELPVDSPQVPVLPEEFPEKPER